MSIQAKQLKRFGVEVLLHAKDHCILYYYYYIYIYINIIVSSAYNETRQ